MPSETITQSRWKTSMLLLASIGFVAAGAYLLTQPASHSHPLATWGAICVFGLGIPISGVLLARPRTLTIDTEGFTLAGGLQRATTRILWSDVDSAFVYRAPLRGGTMIGLRYRPGHEPQAALARALGALGVQGALPAGWSLSPEAVAARLNAWRTGAV